MRKRLAFLVTLSLMMAQAAYANRYFRTFWAPTFQGEPLNFCTDRYRACGKKPAELFCQKMGYDHVARYLKASDVGFARDIQSNLICHHALCDSYKMIKCMAGKIENNNYYTYYAKKRKFYKPRYHGYRVAWCYSQGRGCGRKAAYSFCRRLGYMGASRYQRDLAIGISQAIGTEERCFGGHCKGFKYIICRR